VHARCTRFTTAQIRARCSRREISGSDGLAAQPARAVQTTTATAATGVRARGTEVVALSRPRRWRHQPRSAQAAPADQQPVHQQLLRRHRRRHADRRGRYSITPRYYVGNTIIIIIIIIRAVR